jgi:uncharacterized delta-60 repeat protein
LIMPKLRPVIGVRSWRFVGLLAVLLFALIGLFAEFFNSRAVVANGSTLSFESSTVTIPEGQTRVITVTRTGAATQPLTATVIATPGTASIADYNLVNTVTPTLLHRLDGYAFKIIPQPDGKILVGGYFTVTNGVTPTNLVRFNPDGSLDNTFSNSGVKDAEGEVRDLLLLPDGKMLVSVRLFYSPNPRPNFLRLNPNGSVDNTFTIITQTSGFASISRVITQADGKLIVGGGINGKMVTRLFPDGTLDTSFNAPTYTSTQLSVNAIAVQADGKVLLGGYPYGSAPQPRQNVIRLNSDGSFDKFFPKIIGVEVYSLLAQADGKIIVAGGGFPPDNGIGRYNSDGNIDADFPSYPIANVGYLTYRPNGKFAAGIGYFGGGGAIKFNADGSSDGSFRYVQGKIGVFALNVQSDDRMLAAIDFDYSPSYTTFVMPQTDLVRLDPKPALSWAAGETGTKTFTVTVNADNLAEIDEQFELGLEFTEGGVTSTSTAKVTVTIPGTAAPTPVELVSTPNPSVYGSVVTFTAIVSPSAATGEIKFREGNVLLGTANLVNGSAVFTTTNLRVGSHVISATYSGNTNYPAGSSNSITQQVSPPDNPFIVTKTTDDSTGNTVGSLSHALKMAGQLQSSSIITFALETGNTITFTGQLQHTVPISTIIDGGATQIILEGGGVAGDGLRLSGNNILRKLWVRNFGGREIVNDGKANKLDAIRVTS